MSTPASSLYMSHVRRILKPPSKRLSSSWPLAVWEQRARKVVSDNLGLVDFAIGLVNSVLNLLDVQVRFFEEFKLQKNCEIHLLIETFLGLVEMMFGLVNVSFSLPKWQAVKMTFLCTLTPLPSTHPGRNIPLEQGIYPWNKVGLG